MQTGDYPETMRRELKEARSEIEGLREESNQMAHEIRARGESLREANRSVAKTRASLDAATESLSVVRAQLREAERRADRLERDLKRVLGRRGVRAALALSRPLRPLFRWWRSLRKGRRKGRRADDGQPISKASYDRGADVRTRWALRIRRVITPGRFDETTVSIVMPTYNRAGVLRAAIESVLSQSHRNWELLIVDDGSTDDTALVVERYTSDPRIRYFKTENRGVSAARNHGLHNATGTLVAYLDSDNTWDPDYLRLLVVKVISQRLDCAYSAVEVVDDSRVTLFYRGKPFDWYECRRSNYVDINALVHRLSSADQEFETTLRRMVDWDFILRLTRDAKVAFVPFVGCRYVASHEDPLRITRREPEVWAEVIRTRHADDRTVVRWEDVAERLKLKFAVKIAAPRDRRQEWGDFHFATSLANALESLGHEVRIDFPEDWRDADRMDVNIVLRGLRELQPQRGAINVLWNISHPDKVSRSELLGYHIVYAASRSHARLIRLDVGDNGQRVRTLMQCTDGDRFNPGLRNQTSPYSADVLFVGNSRADFRPMVKWALEADLDIRVYGRGWSDIVDDPRIENALIDNRELGAAYANSSIVLSDHWSSMRDFGIVSNRVFDVAATGTRQISDRQPALDSVFGPIISQVASADELRSAVDAAGPPAGDLLELAKWVIGRHTFADRARAIVDDVLSYLNLPRKYETPTSGDSLHRFKVASEGARIKVGIAIPRDSNGVEAETYRRLISPLSTEHACDRLDVVEVKGGAIPDDLDVLILAGGTISALDHAEELVRSARARGVSVIVDVPDAVAPSTALMAHPTFRGADSVWFSSTALQRSLPGVAHSSVVADSIDPRIWRHYARTTAHQPRGEGSRRLLILSERISNEDCEFVYSALRQLANRFSFDLLVVGASAEEAPDEPWLRTAKPPAGATSERAFVQWLLEQGPFDIGLAPLSDTPSNRGRSDLEFLAYSALGLLSVVSELPPYTDVIKDRELAVVTSDDDWPKALTEIFESPWRFKSTRERAQQYVWGERTVESTSELMVSEIENLVARNRDESTIVASSPSTS